MVADVPHGTSSAAKVEGAAFRQAMRQLAGGVCVITVSSDDGVGGHAHAPQRTGLTATSVVSLSVDPAELVVSINQASSAWPVLLEARRFGVNVLTAAQAVVAKRFSGAGGLSGAQRFADAPWQRTEDGVWLLAGALAGFACTLEHTWLHRSHALVVGRVNAITGAALAPKHRDPVGPLLYWQGDYARLADVSASG
jgi:flavin reductase (DIM6/NTAB) family NADH-FMN oxidoreductase RutF